jgi:hypothetical protein
LFEKSVDTAGTVRLQLQQLDLQIRGIRAADALHAASAIAFDADIIFNRRGGPEFGWRPGEFARAKNCVPRYGFSTGGAISA